MIFSYPGSSLIYNICRYLMTMNCSAEVLFFGPLQKLFPTSLLFHVWDTLQGGARCCVEVCVTVTSALVLLFRPWSIFCGRASAWSCLFPWWQPSTCHWASLCTALSATVTMTTRLGRKQRWEVVCLHQIRFLGDSTNQYTDWVHYSRASAHEL